MKLAIAQRITLAHAIKGGMEVQAAALCVGLAERGHSVEIITTGEPDYPETMRLEGLRTHYLPGHSPKHYSSGWWNASYAKLKELAAAQQVELLLSQSAGALAYLPRARRELRLPTVLLMHMGLGAGLDSQWRAARSVRGLARLGLTALAIPHHFLLWRRACAAADAIIAVSHAVARDVEREFGADPARIHTIPNGIPLDRFQAEPAARARIRAELHLAPETPVAIAVTRLVPEKGVQVALEALAKVPALHLLVAGTGPYAATLQALAHRLGVATRVHFLGFITHAQLPSYLSAADLFVMPTLYREGFPVSIVEAMACGLAPVVSNVGGIPTAITHARTGLLVPPGAPAALATALEGLMRDPARRAQLGAAARTEAETRFSVTRMVTDTEAVLNQARAAFKVREQ